MALRIILHCPDVGRKSVLHEPVTLRARPSRTLDLEALLERLLDHLMRLLTQADRAMVLLCEGGDKNLVVRGQRCRHQQDASAYPYSRTVVRRALDDGVGILSEDVKDDQ